MPKSHICSSPSYDPGRFEGRLLGDKCSVAASRILLFAVAIRCGLLPFGMPRGKNLLSVVKKSIVSGFAATFIADVTG